MGFEVCFFPWVYDRCYPISSDKHVKTAVIKRQYSAVCLHTQQGVQGPTVSVEINVLSGLNLAPPTLSTPHLELSPSSVTHHLYQFTSLVHCQFILLVMCLDIMLDFLSLTCQPTGLPTCLPINLCVSYMDSKSMNCTSLPVCIWVQYPFSDITHRDRMNLPRMDSAGGFFR